MQNVQNSKKKEELLENELIKLESELSELEKKYGSFELKGISPQKMKESFPSIEESAALENNEENVESSNADQFMTKTEEFVIPQYDAHSTEKAADEE